MSPPQVPPLSASPFTSISPEAARAITEAMYPGARCTAFSARFDLDDDTASEVQRAFAVGMGGRSAVVGLTAMAAQLLRDRGEQATAFAALQSLCSALGWPDGWCREITLAERRATISPHPDRLVRSMTIDVPLAQLMSDTIAVVDVITDRR